MKFTIGAISAMAMLAVAAPVAAQTNAGFTGARAELQVGVNDITKSPDANDVVYGAAVGVDFPVGDRVTLGAEVNSLNVFEDTREIGVAGRLGYAFTPGTLGYVKAGYNNYRDVWSRKLDGVTVGAGLEAKISKMTFVKAEYRYTDLEKNAGSHAGLVGLGLRF